MGYGNLQIPAVQGTSLQQSALSVHVCPTWPQTLAATAGVGATMDSTVGSSAAIPPAIPSLRATSRRVRLEGD
jgi:hypothetical protein